MSGEGPFGVRGGGAPAEEPARRSPPPPAPLRRRSVASWIVGVAVVLAIAYITLNTLRTQAPGSRGVRAGSPLPPFAAPLASSSVDDDTNANVSARASEDVRRPACAVRGPEILNSCELAERGPVVLAFTATRSQRCERQVDLLDRIRGRFPGVGFGVVAIKSDRGELREEVARRGWTLPVAYDHDGAVANLYAVAVCPTITFAFKGGEVQGTSLGLLEGAALERRIAELRGAAP